MKKTIEINPFIKPWNKKGAEEELPETTEFIGAYEYREMLIDEAIASLFITQEKGYYTLWSVIHLFGSCYSEWSNVLKERQELEIQNVLTQKKTRDKAKAIDRMISIYNQSMSGLAGLEQRVL